MSYHIIKYNIYFEIMYGECKLKKCIVIIYEINKSIAKEEENILVFFFIILILLKQLTNLYIK